MTFIQAIYTNLHPSASSKSVSIPIWHYSPMSHNWIQYTKINTLRARLVTKSMVKIFSLSTIVYYIQVWQLQIIADFLRLKYVIYMILGPDLPPLDMQIMRAKGVGIKVKIPPLLPIVSTSPVNSHISMVDWMFGEINGSM